MRTTNGRTGAAPPSAPRPPRAAAAACPAAPPARREATALQPSAWTARTRCSAGHRVAAHGATRCSTGGCYRVLRVLQTIRALWRYSGYLAVLSGHSIAARQRITRQASLRPHKRRGLSARTRAPNREPQVPYATRCAALGAEGTRTSSSSEDASSSRTSPATGTYEYPLSTLAQRGPALPPVATESEHLATRARHVAAQRNGLRCAVDAATQG
jgi:hypothetical protein